MHICFLHNFAVIVANFQILPEIIFHLNFTLQLYYIISNKDTMSYCVNIRLLASQGHTLGDHGIVCFFLNNRKVIVPLSSISTSTTPTTKIREHAKFLVESILLVNNTMDVHLLDSKTDSTHGTLAIPLQRLSTDGHRIEQWYQLSPTPEAGRSRPTLRLALHITHQANPIKGEKLYSVELDTRQKTKLGATIRVDSSGAVRIAHINPTIDERPSPLAAHGGVSISDEMLSVNEFPVKGMALDQVVRLLQFESRTQSTVLLRLQNATKEQRNQFLAELEQVETYHTQRQLVEKERRRRASSGGIIATDRRTVSGTTATSQDGIGYGNGNENGKRDSDTHPTRNDQDKTTMEGKIKTKKNKTIQQEYDGDDGEVSISSEESEHRVMEAL